jgi:hypothetical protein
MALLSDVLRRVYWRLEDGWCQGWFARDRHGSAVIASDSRACCWCLTGAVQVECVALGLERTVSAIYAALVAVLPPTHRVLADWNDTRGMHKRSVLNLVEAALRIQLAKEAEGTASK